MTTHVKPRGKGAYSVSRKIFVTIAGLLFAALGFGSGIPEPPLVWYGQVRNNAGGRDVRLTAGTLSWTVRPLNGGSLIVLEAQLTNLNDQFSYVLFVPCESDLPGLAVSSNVIKLTPPDATYVRTNVTWNGQPLFFRTPSLGTLQVSPGARARVERIDLGLAEFSPDSDADGLPDWWETAYPGAGDPAGDTDGDGLSNLREYVAGTNPEDSASCFEFVSVEPWSPGVVRVQWSSVAGKSYSILRAPTLSTSPLDYLVIQSGIAATAPLNSFDDTTANGPGPWFYRLRIGE